MEKTWDTATLLKVANAMRLLGVLGAPVIEIFGWAISAPTMAQARTSAQEAKRAHKARYDNEAWLEVASSIADQLRTDDTIRIAIEGHTDSVGSEESNQQLSENRSNAVRDYLVSSGLTTGHITSAGKGEADPVATNKTAAGRQQNRRVELIITNE